MDKKILMIIGAVVLLIVCCASSIAAFFILDIPDKLSNDDDKKESEKKDDNGNNSGDNNGEVSELKTEAEKKQFLEDMVTEYSALEDQDLTMEGDMSMVEEGATISLGMKIRTDNGNTETTMSAGGYSMVILNIEGEEYIGNGSDTWYKSVSGEELFDTSDMVPTDEVTDVEGMLGTDNPVEGTDYNYKGVISCNSGKCHEFEIIDDATGGTATILVDAETKHITQMDFDMGEEGSGSFTFNYDAVSLTAPSDYQEMTDENSLTVLFDIMIPVFQAAGFPMDDLGL